jgi:hypothetical protein
VWAIAVCSHASSTAHNLNHASHIRRSRRRLVNLE